MYNHFVRKIVMISDYVEDYDEIDKSRDKIYLTLLKKELKAENIEFEYIESKSLEELEKTLSKFDKNEIVIFNWFEEIPDIPNSGPQVIKFLEDRNYVFTGASSKNLADTQSKEFIKNALVKNGVTTPKAQIMRVGERGFKFELNFPVIIKTANQHMSVGIDRSSVVEDIGSLEKKAAELFRKYNQDLIIEEFVIGKEYEVSVWGNETLQTLPPIEVHFENANEDGIDVYTYDSKWEKGSKDYEALKYESAGAIEPNLLHEIEKESHKTFRALECQDFVRMELRIKDGKAYVFDVNVNPYLNYDATFFVAAKQLGYNHGQTVAKICEFALKRSLS